MDDQPEYLPGSTFCLILEVEHDHEREPKMTANVVPIRPIQDKTTRAKTRESEKKWGKKVIALGFCVVPSLLLRAQSRLGLNPTQLAVLMQLCDYWWDNDRKPYPGKKALAERLSLGPRQVQRYVAELEQAGLVRRIERRAAHGGKLTNAYDLSGLVERLKKLEPDFRAVKEDVRNARKAVARPRNPRATAKPGSTRRPAHKN